MEVRFLVAPDSFKGTFDGGAVAEAIAGGIEVGGGEADRCPVADGGEGTMDVLLAALGGERRVVAVHDAEAVARLAARLDALAGELPRDPRGVPMTGCAGGLSGGLWAYGARLLPGAAFVLNAVGFDARLARANVVISGEGRFDSQSLAGKIVGEVASRCDRAGRPLHLIVGENGFDRDPPAAISSIAEAGTLEEMQRASSGLAGGEN